MKRLAEVNLLPKVQLISAVSGGSIVGAFVALRWKDWLAAGGDGPAFDAVVLRPFRELVEQENILRTWIGTAWTWPFRRFRDRAFSRTRAMSELLDRRFYGNLAINELPDSPVLVLNASSLQSMRAWHFTKWGCGDSRIGHASWGDNPLSLGLCVTASAAFPPVFPPVRLRTQTYSFSGPIYKEKSLPLYPFVPLTDGGVYDNMGLEVLIKSARVPGIAGDVEPSDFLVVSDGGAPPNLHLRSSGLPAIGEALLMYRVNEISREQVSALRIRGIVGDLVSKKRQGLFVSLRSDVSRIGEVKYRHYRARVDEAYLVPPAIVEMIRSIRTNLDRFSDVESTALIYHAYMMTDAFLWSYDDTFSREFRVRQDNLPQGLIRFTQETIQEWSRGLTHSAKRDQLWRTKRGHP